MNNYQGFESEFVSTDLDLGIQNIFIQEFEDLELGM